MKSKRFLSILLTLCMVLMLVPITAFAETYYDDDMDLKYGEEITDGIFNGRVTIIAGTISGGTFNGYVQIDSGTIFGGTFEGQVNSAADGVISGGTFNGEVDSGGRITDGKFNNKVTSARFIGGGTFYGAVESKGGVISGGTFYDAVVCDYSVITGGTFYGEVSGVYDTKNAEIYTISFELNGGKPNGGSESIPTQYFVNTDTSTALKPSTDPTREGFTFEGWYNGETEYEFTSPVTQNITLTAKWTDIAAPTGEICVDTNKWTQFLNNIIFGKFFKETKDVEITASDNSGENVTIEYYLSNQELSADELATKSFTAYSDKFNINPDNEYVIYAKLTDTSGNVAYICSDGIVLDSTVPVISGVENGKTYCAAQTVTVTEEYIESVTVNGNAVTLDENNQFTLNPADGTQTIVVTDKAGNVSAEMTVTVNNGHSGGAATCIAKAVCEVCGEEYGELDSTNHNTVDNIITNSPQTGDNIIMFIVIFVIALTGILGIFIINNKKVKNNK